MSDTEYNSDSDSDDIQEPIKLNTQISTQNILSIYYTYLKSDTLLLKPDYQREFCWNLKKQKTLINTIMNNWIIPNFVIYKLSKKERKIKKHEYECIDGQHRLLTIKQYIENTNPNLYYKDNEGKKVYYNNNKSILKDKNKRNLNDIELNTFNLFNLTFNIIEPDNNEPLEYRTKTQIFNLLQNGVPVSSYDTIKNYDNPVIIFIRKHHLMDYLKDINFNNTVKIYSNNNIKIANKNSTNLILIIRTLVILSNKNLNINYSDCNVKTALAANDYKGTEMVYIKNFTNLELQFKEIITLICSLVKITLIPELFYIIINIYANYNIDIITKVLSNIELLDKYNIKALYIHSNNTTIEKVTKQYLEITKKILSLK